MKILSILLSLFIIANSCFHKKPIPWNGPTLTQPRNQLTVEQLLSDSTFILLDMGFFAKPEWAQKTSNKFSGSISLKETKLNFPMEGAPFKEEDMFPEITIDFISHESELIPLNKNLIFNKDQEDGYWNVIVGTGAVWQEEEDGEWSRASFPLTLTESYMGQVRNCIATFVYNRKEISNICLQSSQETTNFEVLHPGDIRATIQAKYEPMHFADSAQIIETHRQYESQRLSVYPLREIDIHGEIAEYFEQSSHTNAPTSLGAVLLDDRLYLHPPKTRHGPYPYPDEMRHSVFSVTKSMAGALSLLYLAERYGEDIFNELITDYVPVLVDHPGWQGVTFSHTLNMVTGTVGSDRDEHFKDVLVMPRTAESCINKIATIGDATGAPGEKFNYGSTNTFVLSYALQKYVEDKEGKEINYWELVHDNVLVPIGAEYFTLRKTIEPDSSNGIPILSYGAIPTLDEAAKIALLFLNEGNYKGQQLLHKEKTKEALGRSSWAGYSTGDDIRGSGYYHSFWSKNIETEKCNIHVTYMLGYGENYALFLPNNVVVFRFMDEHDLDVSNLVRSVEKIKSSCEQEKGKLNIN